MKKTNDGFTVLSYLALIIVVALIAAVAFTVYNKQKVNPDEVYRKYLTKYLSTTYSEQKESLTGSGSSVSALGVLDTSNKKILINADLSCDAKVGDKPVSLKATIQQENAAGYIKFNSFSGEIVNLSTGNNVDIPKVYAKTIGNWYKIAENTAQKAQIDSGVYVFDTGIVAPGADKNKAVDALLNKKALVYTYAGKDGNNLVYNVTAHKDAYLSVLKETFPNLSSPDLALDNAFGDKSSKDAKIIVTKSGDPVSETISETNLCVELVNSYIGDKNVTGLAKDVTGSNASVSKGTVKITPVTSSKPIESFSKDIVF